MPTQLFHSLPLELVGQILEVAVRSHRDIDMRWAAALQLVSRATRQQLLAPLFYVFVVDWPVFGEPRSASYTMLLNLVQNPATAARAHVRHIVLVASTKNHPLCPLILRPPVDWQVDSICLLPDQTLKDVASFRIVASYIHFTDLRPVLRVCRTIYSTRLPGWDSSHVSLATTELGVMLSTRSLSHTPGVLVGGVLTANLVRAIETTFDGSTDTAGDSRRVHLHIRLELSTQVHHLVRVVVTLLSISELIIVLHVGYAELISREERAQQADLICCALGRDLLFTGNGTLSERVFVESSPEKHGYPIDGTSYALARRTGWNPGDKGVSLDEYLVNVSN